jgi:hypothetical protein
MAGKRSFSSEKSQEEAVDERSAYEFSWQVNSYLNGYIQFGDAKAGAIVTFFTIVLGFYTGFWPEASKSGWFWLGVGVSLLPIVMALLVITPRFIREKRKGMIFWEHIADHGSPEEYEEALRQTNLFEEIAKQNYRLAQISRQKYTWLRWAMYTTWGALLYLTISFAIAAS